MNPYVIITDTGCDIHPDTLKEWGVECLNLLYRFESGEETAESTKAFYARMRTGGVATTSAINPDTFFSAFESHLKQGEDVLYLSFSSGLSTTYNSACIAASDLQEVYPQRKIRIVDTLCASAGQGLLVYLVKCGRDSGADLDTLADYAARTVPNICHWFTVDDLVYLKRGGRVSPTTAFVGNMLGIKPVLHVDNQGKLVNVLKARGRKASLKALADRFGKTSTDKCTVFISHADCEEDARLLETMLRENYGGSVEQITYIGPVIGAHAGPGTVALFFVGTER